MGADAEEGAEGAAQQRLQRAALVPYLHRPAPPHNREPLARPRQLGFRSRKLKRGGEGRGGDLESPGADFFLAC